MNIKKRIVLTGLGTINAMAKDVPGLTRALREGVCGIGPLDIFDTRELRTKNGGQIKVLLPATTFPANIR
jgi:nodulation protein E